MSVIVAPEFIQQTNSQGVKYDVEKYKNNSVMQAINYAINRINTQYQDINQVVDDLKSMLFDDINDTNTMDKANSICKHLLSSGSLLKSFMDNVTTDYERILEYDHINFTTDIIDDCARITGIAIDKECLYDVNNKKYTDPKTWFANRISLYNPLVNFEHVCLVVDIMLNNPRFVYTEVIYPFFYFVRCWLNNHDKMRWLICHYIKLIRVNILSKYTRTTFKPVNLFTNIRFGYLTDQNIELYGDIRLPDNMSCFSTLPRTHITKLSDMERTIFYSWNDITPTNEDLNNNYRSVDAVIDDDVRGCKYPYDIFMMLTHFDIKPRLKCIRDNQYNVYKTVIIDDKRLMVDNNSTQTEEDKKYVADLITMIPEALYIALINRLGESNFTCTRSELTFYGSCIIYITYTGFTGVETVCTHHTFRQLVDAINLRKNSKGEFIPVQNIMNIKVEDYIPTVTGNFSCANRMVITKTDKSWENYYRMANGLLPFPFAWGKIATEHKQPENLSKF